MTDAGQGEGSRVEAGMETVEALSLERLPAEDRERVRERMAAISLKDSLSIIGFGADTQRELTSVSEQLLEGVRNKDTGEAGEALSAMMSKLRGIDVAALREDRQPGWFARLWGAVAPVQRFLQSYESVKSQVEAVVADLEVHQGRMLRDITLLERLYESTLGYFHALELDIAAASLRLAEIDGAELPEAQAQAQQSNSTLDAQAVRDLQTARDDLERKLHDLKLTRQVVMQWLPSVKMTQDLDKSLVNKIQSAVINTIPLWKTQLSQAVTTSRTREAAQRVRSVSDLNNEMLKASASALNQANRETRREIERGIYDIDSIEAANESLVGAIRESLSIAEEGRRQRTEAEGRLAKCEDALKQALRQPQSA